MRVAALGRTRMLYDALPVLAAAGHEIAFVATCRAAPEYDVREEDFERRAGDLNADFLLTQDLNAPDVVRRLRASDADIAVSVNWVNLVGPDACGAFPNGVLNAHAGDLPRYRGNAPVAWAILQGEAHVALTVHQMDPHELDAGPVVLKRYFALADDTYIGEVMAWLDHEVPRALCDAVDGLACGDVVPQPQPTDPSLALRCYPRRPEDGRVVWSASAVLLGRQVRACAEPFAGCFCTLPDGSRLTIWRARPRPWTIPSLAVPGQVVGRDHATGSVAVATGEGVLVLEEVEADGTGRVRAVEVLRSLRDRLT